MRGSHRYRATIIGITIGDNAGRTHPIVTAQGEQDLPSRLGYDSTTSPVRPGDCGRVTVTAAPSTAAARATRSATLGCRNEPTSRRVKHEITGFRLLDLVNRPEING
jgi:hypothetical protein